MSQKGFVPLTIIGIVALALVVCVAGYFTWKSKKLHSQIQQQTSSQPLPLIDGIPQGIAKPTADRITTMPGGAPIIKDEIDVSLKFDTPSPSQRIKQIAAVTNGVIIGSDSDLLIYQLRYNVDSLQQLDPIRTTISTMQDVEAAVLVPLGGPTD